MSDIAFTLEKWYSSKQKMRVLEERIERYRQAIAKELNSKGVSTLSGGDYTVTRRRNVKTTLSKDSVPKEIWDKYSKKSSYDAFFLKKNS